MPYFERLPYAEMIARAAKSSVLADQAQSPPKLPGDMLPLLEQAKAILKEESGALPSASMGKYPLPFPTATSPIRNGAGDVLLLNSPPPVKGGETATVVLSIVNDSGSSVSFSVMTTHLISRSGARIAANNVDISPEKGVLGPSQSVDIQVAVNVPNIIMPGEYAGLLQAYGQETTHAVLVVNVTG